MLSKLGILLAATAVAASAGAANMAFAQGDAGRTAYAGSDPRKDDDMARSANLSYQAGAYYYGSDCGGNSVKGTDVSVRRKGAAAGVILGGAMGSVIAHDMNCDDRRQAMSSYRDGLEGLIGLKYDWRNSNGGGSGSITPVRQYISGGYTCRDFREVTISSQQSTSRTGTACRQSDGNWHTL